MPILIFTGLFVGLLSGFFGIGGGTILLPILLYLGFDIKTAIGISIIQMAFSSIFGSLLEAKKGVLNIKEGALIGLGGFFGGLGSGYLVKIAPAILLQYLFLSVVLFALFRFFKSPVEIDKEELVPPRYLFFIMGILIGLFGMSVGVGGSILVTPILVGFFRYKIKKAKAMGLFFVTFSSISGLISRLYFGNIDINTGIITGVASLIGVFVGIKIAYKIETAKFKHLMLFMYIVVFILTVNKIFHII